MLPDSVLLHRVLPDTLCSYTASYLAQRLFVHSVIFGTQCVTLLTVCSYTVRHLPQACYLTHSLQCYPICLYHNYGLSLPAMCVGTTVGCIHVTLSQQDM